MTPTTIDHRIRVLLLEDVAADADLVQQALEQSGLAALIQQVDRRDDYVKALEEGRPDVILADRTLSTIRDTDALQMARDHHPDVPFIFVSGAVGEERAVEAIK